MVESMWFTAISTSSESSRSQVQSPCLGERQGCQAETSRGPWYLTSSDRLRTTSPTGMPVYCPPVSGDSSGRWNFMPLALATGPIKPGQASEHQMMHIIKGNVLGWPSLWQQASHDPSVTMVPGIFVVVALSDIVVSVIVITEVMVTLDI